MRRQHNSQTDLAVASRRTIGERDARLHTSGPIDTWSVPSFVDLRLGRELVYVPEP